MSFPTDLLPDQFDSLLENNFDLSSCNNDDFISKIETELDTNYMDDLIFSDENTGKEYRVMNDEAAKIIISKLEAREETFHQIKKTTTYRCTHCDEYFTSESFTRHVCKYDENKRLIDVVVPEDNESELSKMRRKAVDILTQNSAMLKRILYGYPPVGSGKSDHAKQSNFECFVCNRKFVHETGLYRHFDKHIGEMLKESEPTGDVLHAVTLCTICGEVFTTESKAWQHLLENHLEVDGCRTYADFRDDLNGPEPNTSARLSTPEKVVPKVENRDVKIHLRAIYVPFVHHCEFCDSVFASENVCLHHISKHEPSAFFSCQTCDLKRLSFKDILIHRHEECWNIRDCRDSLKDIPCVFMCNVCDEIFHGIEQLILHRQKQFHFFPRVDHKTNQIQLACETCLLIFDSAPKLVAHLEEKHLRKMAPSVVPETSTRAPKSPTNRGRKGGSLQTSKRPRQYLCEVCGKAYTQSSHLWQHLRFHQGVKPFVCPHDECDRRFTIRPDLNDHIRKCHTGERPFLCTICGKRFLTGSVYYQHRLIHRGERRYACGECGKRFYRADALKNHERIHTGERPYPCWVENCDKSFRQRGDRDKHVRARHKDAEPNTEPLKRQKVMSFGRGRTKNNTSLYNSKPAEGTTQILM